MNTQANAALAELQLSAMSDIMKLATTERALEKVQATRKALWNNMIAFRGSKEFETEEGKNRYDLAEQKIIKLDEGIKMFSEMCNKLEVQMADFAKV